MSISEDKKRSRRVAEALRLNFVHAVPDAGELIAQNFFAAIPIPDGTIVSSYVAARGELDPLPLMRRLTEAGCDLALSRVAAKAQPLHFHLWREDEIPVKSAFGVMEASPEWPRVTPDVLLVPLLGFDEKGYRLGYGGGFYDRTLQALRQRASVLAVGIAFAGQEMVLPHDSYDERLDWIVTEKFARKFTHEIARNNERD